MGDIMVLYVKQTWNPKWAASWILPVLGRLTTWLVITEDARADVAAIETLRRGLEHGGLTAVTGFRVDYVDLQRHSFSDWMRR
jgi:hypothetical protein